MTVCIKFTFSFILSTLFAEYVQHNENFPTSQQEVEDDVKKFSHAFFFIFSDVVVPVLSG